MSQRFVGVDLGVHQVKVVVVTSGLRGVSVHSVYKENVEAGVDGGADIEASVEVAAALLRSAGLASEAVTVAMPGSVGSYRMLSFPFTDPRRIEQAVVFEAEGQFPQALEDLRHDHVVVPAPGAGGRAMMVAVREERARAVEMAFEDQGIKLRGLTVTPLALAQAVEPAVVPLPQTESDDPDAPRLPVTLVVDMGHRTTEFTAIADKGPVMSRSVRVGGRDLTAALAEAYKLPLDQAEAAKREDGFVPNRTLGEMSSEQLQSGKIVAVALESLVREVEHTRMWLRASHGYEVTRLVLAGGGAQLHGLDGYLAEQIGLDVERLGDKIASVVRSGGDRDWTVLASALGAAIGAARRPLIQLQAAGGAGSDASWLQQRMSTLIAIGVAIMAFGALDTIAQIKAVEAEHDARMHELGELSERVLGERMTRAADVEEKLKEADGRDLSSLVPTRGALEVLAMISEAAKAQDAGAATDGPAGSAPAMDPSGAPIAPGSAAAAMAAAGGDDEEGDDADGEESKGPLAPVADPSKGIYRDDELLFSMVDIRERKIELKVSATRASAQDRLAIKLQETGCLTNVSKGKVRDQNDRKVFEMSMDNACYFEAKSEEDGESDDESAEG